MANEKLRGYRRGIPYRTGDVKEDVVLKEFKFKGIEYGVGYGENDKKRYLNYAYDALKDLSAILNMPSNVVSLLNKENKKPTLYFGEANKGHTNFIVNKDGTTVRNWVYFLDKFLGQGNDIGLFNSLDMNNLDDSAACRLLHNIKFKEKEVDRDSLTSDKLEKYKSDLSDLIDNMPFLKNAPFETIAAVEDSRSRFLKDFTDDSFKNMVSAFESNGLSLGDLKSKLLELLKGIQEEYNVLLVGEKNADLLLTDFYKAAENRNNIENTTKYTTNLELFVTAVEYYIYNKLKETSCYNNFLINPSELDAISITPTETPIILGAVKNFFDEILPQIIEMLNVEDEEDVAETVDNTENENISNVEAVSDEVQNIDKVLNEDKGKFKLTLFKKLAKDIGLKVDQSRSEKTDSGVYYIYFTEGYIKYIKPAVYNNPSQKNHCINVYCGEKGDTKQGYWWDNELNYNDLVNYLVNIENEHRKEIAKTESRKVNKELDKFKLTEFKTACTKMNLTVDKSETPIVDKKYIIRFGNRNYITYIAAPVHIDSNSKKEQRIKIKTMREEVYHTWVGKLEYKPLLENILKIEQEGQAVLKEEKAELLRKKEQLEKEKAEMLKQIQKTKAEYEKAKVAESKQLSALMSCDDLESTKDLRDKMVKYIQIQHIHLSEVSNVNAFENILKANISSIDNVDLRIERTVIPEKQLKGNSKAWGVGSENCILLQNRLDNRKQLEGLIEAFVDMKLKSKNYSKIEKQMYRESLTFMFCKAVGLDVRTYCNSALFERFVKSGSNVSSYLSKTFKLFNNLLVYFQ